MPRRNFELDSFMRRSADRTAWNELGDKPSFLFSTRSRFTGDVLFQAGWAILKMTTIRSSGFLTGC